MDDTGAQADRARNRVRDAENLIDHARQELDKAKDAVGKVVSEVTVVPGAAVVSELMELTRCWCCLQDIKPHGGTGEPNNMTLLAEEARRLADK